MSGVGKQRLRYGSHGPRVKRELGWASCGHSRATYDCPRCQTKKCRRCYGKTNELLCTPCDIEAKRKFLASLPEHEGIRHIDHERVDALVEKIRRA